MANEDMIQRHEDNFLAKIAGETPVDTHVRNSKEFWLDQIGGVAAEWEAGKSTDDASTKKIYCHPITLRDDGTGTIRCRITCLIFNNDETAFTKDSLKTFIDALYVINNSAKIMFSGAYYNGTTTCITSYVNRGASTYNIVGLTPDGAIGTISYSTFESLFPASILLDDGVNAIN